MRTSSKSISLMKTYHLTMKSSFLLILFSITTLFAGEKPFYEESFKTDNRAIFLPVQIDNKECMFLFDTGASFVVLDQSYRHLLAEPMGLEEAESHMGVELSERGVVTPNGEIALQLYKSVPLKLGRLQIANRFPYILADLKPLWPLSGVEFCGVLGSSFLHQFRWEIDFEKGNIKAYIGVTPYEMKKDFFSSITWSRGYIPQLELILEGKKVSFDIDTGDIGSGRLVEENINLLKQRGLIIGTHQREVFTVSGSSEHEEFRLKRLRLKGRDYPGVVLQESKQNALGLGFFQRHKVVLDFPFNKLYLQPHKDHTDEEEVDKSGIRLLLENNKIIVFNIKPMQGADMKGVERGDEIISVNGKANISLYQMRKVLRGKEGTELTLGLKRNSKLYEVNIVLGKDPLSLK